MDSRIIGFVLAGGVATVLNYGIFLFLLALEFHLSLAAAIGYLSGIVVSFAINRYFVFKGSKRSSFAKYALAYLMALGGQLLLLNALVALGLVPEIANALAILVVVFLNFFLVRKLAF